MAGRFVFRGVRFCAGMHTWSNPKIRGTPAELPIVMAKSTLYDLVELGTKYPVSDLRAVNEQFLAAGEITPRQHELTEDWLRKLEIVLARRRGQ